MSSMKEPKREALQSAQSRRYQKQLLTEKWNPTDDHAINIITDYLICVREDMNSMIEDLVVLKSMPQVC